MPIFSLSEKWLTLGQKQSYRCHECGHQFVESPNPKAYHPEVKQLCLKMYFNGIGLTAIARVTQINHATIINWVKQASVELSDEPLDTEIPEITEIDELQTFVAAKKNKVWIWRVVNHWKEGILLWVIGVRDSDAPHYRSSQTFELLWQIIKCWLAFLVCNRWLQN